MAWTYNKVVAPHKFEFYVAPQTAGGTADAVISAYFTLSAGSTANSNQAWSSITTAEFTDLPNAERLGEFEQGALTFGVENGNSMHWLILGAGSIGRRHAANIRSLWQTAEITVFDPNKENLSRLAEITDIKLTDASSTLHTIKPDICVICTPNHLHLEQALFWSQRDCHLFIEKPLSHTLEGIDELYSTLQKSQKKAMVACNMRFHPNIKKVKQLIDENKKYYAVIKLIGYLHLILGAVFLVNGLMLGIGAIPLYIDVGFCFCVGAGIIVISGRIKDEYYQAGDGYEEGADIFNCY